VILKPTSAIRHRLTMSSRRYSLDVRRRLLVLLALLLVGMSLTGGAGGDGISSCQVLGRDNPNL